MGGERSHSVLFDATFPTTQKGTQAAIRRRQMLFPLVSCSQHLKRVPVIYSCAQSTYMGKKVCTSMLHRHTHTHMPSLTVVSSDTYSV